MEYQEFINQKKALHKISGFEVERDKLNPKLFEFQKDIVLLSLKKGKFCIFSECGTGKTLMQIEWAKQIIDKENKSVLIITPLAVNLQTINEGVKIGVKIEKYNNQKEVGIYVINYEQLNNISMNDFIGVVLDESSILKNYNGSYRNMLIENCKNIKYKLCCTASPSPNDELEIGNHSEFIDNMTSMDMRALFFTTEKNRIHGDKYRLKKHSLNDFYAWISEWAIVLTKPSDLGYDDKDYILPKLNIIEHKIETDIRQDNLELFNEIAVSAITFNSELRKTLKDRTNKTLEIVNSNSDSFIIWVKHNEEGDLLEKLIPGSRQVQGSDKTEIKEKNLIDFANGKYRVLITKAKIAQFGLNFQNCHNQTFCSLDFSFESLYQAIRRSYRFGQKKDVNIYIITTDTMSNVMGSIHEKQEKFNLLRKGIMENKDRFNNSKQSMERKEISGKDYTIIQNDCIVECDNIQDETIDFIFFSPPFGAMYVFSDNPEDLSNVKDNDEFYKHFKYLIPKLFRVLKQGRLCSLHVMQSTTLVGRDGFYSIKDFRGDIIRLFQEAGFYFHAENMIRKDPKTAAIRTKNHQLMYGTTKKDSSVVRPGLADYIITFRKPGQNQVPIVNDIGFDRWCKIAEPVWIDIEESDTLPFRGARDDKDERHITATQLSTIENCYLMWTNKNDTVLSPFAGIGSEGYKALEMNRKFIGIELKESYFNIMLENMEGINKIKEESEKDLFNLKD